MISSVLKPFKGEKIFWFIPPTKKNFELFQKWTMSGSQDKEFFGENVEDCQRIKIKKGETLLMPAGMSDFLIYRIKSKAT